jgi:adenosyl cobinamide kinase/adenosyl cobinamide phosphate guanylyltransferase
MEHLLGMPSRFILCGRYTILTDELSKLTKETSILVISCLTNIVSNLLSSADVKTAIEKAMSSIGAMLRELTKTIPEMRIIVAHCTPRTIPDFDTHARFAMVRWRVYLIRVTYLVSKSSL